jgi:hypothetical protein
MWFDTLELCRCELGDCSALGNSKQPARTCCRDCRMRQWRYRILPLLARDGMSFEVVVASDTEGNARRQLAAQYPSDCYQIAYMGEVR